MEFLMSMPYGTPPFKSYRLRQELRVPSRKRFGRALLKATWSSSDRIEDVNGIPHVYAVRNSTIQILPVKTGIKSAEQEEIRSGLVESDVVIVRSDRRREWNSSCLCRTELHHSNLTG